MAELKEYILSEIRRTALENDGSPLGFRLFATKTGIKETEWKGKIWARWGDAVREAGFEANKLIEAYSAVDLLDAYARLALEMQRLPTSADLRLYVRNGAKFPEWKTFQRQFGGKPQLVAKLKEYCADRSEFANVISMCDDYEAPRRREITSAGSESEELGYVYLIKHGSRREYRIGCTRDVLRREGEITIALPEKVRPIHVITTDDPFGIEAYWHKRFANKRKNADWFELDSKDVAAFKRRRFM